MGLLNGCFRVSGLKLRGALGYLRGFNQVDNQMGGVYHRFQGQKCSRSAYCELIWGIPVTEENKITTLASLRLFVYITYDERLVQ